MGFICFISILIVGSILRRFEAGLLIFRNYGVSILGMVLKLAGFGMIRSLLYGRLGLMMPRFISISVSRKFFVVRDLIIMGEYEYSHLNSSLHKRISLHGLIFF